MAAGDFVSGPCDTPALLEFGSLGFCSREDGTGTCLSLSLLTYLRPETQCGKKVLSSSSLRKGIGCLITFLGRSLLLRPPPKVNVRCRILKGGGQGCDWHKAWPLASQYSCGHTFSAPHSGQGVARAVGGRETWLGCSFALSGRYRSPTDGASAEHRWCPREFPELCESPEPMCLGA